MSAGLAEHSVGTTVWIDTQPRLANPSSVSRCAWFSTAMSRYVFDLHDNGPAEWDADQLHDADRDAIERRARELIEDAQRRQRARDGSASMTTVFVHEAGDGIVLTAYGRPGQDLQLVWTSSGDRR